MQSFLRKSWPARVSAIGFIAVVIVGNIWATYGMTQHPVPQWVGLAMASSIGFTMFGGICLMTLMFWYRFVQPPELGERAATEEDTNAPDV